LKEIVDQMHAMQDDIQHIEKAQRLRALIEDAHQLNEEI
jgi:hypothetical protein